jgi:hypothetical protein
MINFRYHIVSLTAVLLALGAGLVLGTTFLDDATVDVLRGQLDGLESDLDESRSHAAELQAQVDALEDEHQAMDDQLTNRVLSDHLAGEPVLVMAPRGIDHALTTRVVEALADANADVLGVWWLTNRFALDDDGDADDLSAVLDLTTSDVTRLQRDLVVRLAGVLDGATDGSTTGVPGAPGPTGSEQVPDEPDLLERLRAGGFVEYEIPEDSDSDVVALPATGVRVVLVTSPNAETPNGLMLDVLNEFASEGAEPVTIVSPTIADEGASGDGDDPNEDDGSANDAGDGSLIRQIREDDRLADRVSTVDNLERVAGKVATVLAVGDADPTAPLTGHYGQGDGAETLLPPPQEGG